MKGDSRVRIPYEEVIQNTLVPLTILAIQKIDESALQTMSRDLMWGEDGHGREWISGTFGGQIGSESRHVLKLSKQPSDTVRAVYEMVHERVGTEASHPWEVFCTHRVSD